MTPGEIERCSSDIPTYYHYRDSVGCLFSILMEIWAHVRFAGTCPEGGLKPLTMNTKGEFEFYSVLKRP